jgi:hypothetical protein
MRLCWADRIPLLLFALITLIMLCLGAIGGSTDTDYCHTLRAIHPEWTSHDSYCFVTATQHWSAFFSIEGTLFLKIVAPIWALLRIVDLSMGDPARRRPNTNAVMTADIDLPRGRWTRLERD